MRNLSIVCVISLIVMSCSFQKQKSIEELKLELLETLHNGDTTSAIEILEEFNKENPENTETEAALIVLKTKAGVMTRDEGYSELAAIKTKDSLNFFTRLLRAKAKVDSTRSASERLQLIEQSISEQPLDFWNHLEKGRVLIELKQFDEAIVSLDKAIELEPENRYAYAEKALAKYFKGYRDEACKEWETSGGGGIAYKEKYCK